MGQITNVGAVECHNSSSCLKEREVRRYRPYFENDANAVPSVHGEVDPVKRLRAWVPIADDRFGDKRPRLRIPARQPQLTTRDSAQIYVVTSDVRGNPGAIAAHCVEG